MAINAARGGSSSRQCCSSNSNCMAEWARAGWLAGQQLLEGNCWAGS
jgi:hypothetical protein